MKHGGKTDALKRLFALATPRKGRWDGVLRVLENVPGKESVCPLRFPLPSSALTLQKLRQPLRSWGSALPGTEGFESSINLNA